jgi:hypothetical protein
LPQARAALTDVPQSIALGYERWTLPGRERMGAAHAQVLFEVAPDWWLGPTVYGAASGQRGGFFVGGVALQRPIELWPRRLWLLPQLAVGGGGGGAAPVGNGLMIRPGLALAAGLGDWKLAAGVSAVRFAGTDIRSQQFALQLEWHSWFRTQPLSRVGERMNASGRSGLGVDRMSLLGGTYRLRAGAPNLNVRLVGVRLDRLLEPGLPVGVEAAAAADGPSAGYMELLAHAGREWTVVNGLQVGVRGALGLGGGGAVPTGGGVIGHAEGTLAWQPGPGWRLGVAAGPVAGRSKGLRGNRVEFSLSADLEPGLDGRGLYGPREGTVRRIEWAGSLQQIDRVGRKDGSQRALQTIGLQLNHWLTPNVYVTGQAHSAFGGGAGAYSIGLLGAGAATAPRWGGWQFGAELLAGGAGGGGVQSLSGAIGQGMAWVGKLPERDGPHWRAGLGVARGKNGPVSPVVQLGWVVPFGQVVR